MLICVETQNLPWKTRPPARLVSIRLGVIPCHAHVVLDTSDSVWSQRYVGSMSTLLGSVTRSMEPGDRLSVWRLGDRKPIFQGDVPPRAMGAFNAPQIKNDWVSMNGTWLGPTSRALNSREQEAAPGMRKVVILVSDGEVWDASEAPAPGVPAGCLKVLRPDGTEPCARTLWKGKIPVGGTVATFSPGPFLHPPGQADAKLILEDPGPRGAVYKISHLSNVKVPLRPLAEHILEMTLPGALELVEVGCPEDREYTLKIPHFGAPVRVSAANRPNLPSLLSAQDKQELEWLHPDWNESLLVQAANRALDEDFRCPACNTESTLRSFMERGSIVCERCKCLVIVNGEVPRRFLDRTMALLFPLCMEDGKTVEIDGPHVTEEAGENSPESYSLVTREDRPCLYVRCV
ncbi:MAG: vWA domain-containing protein [Pseudomonadota bacterium]